MKSLHILDTLEQKDCCEEHTDSSECAHFDDKEDSCKTSFSDENTIKIILPAKCGDELSWEKELQEAKAAKESAKKILWIFDLGIDPVRCSLTDEAIFASQALALLTFSKLFPQYADSTIGVVIAKSALFRELDEKDDCEKLDHLDEPFKTHLSAMTLFADYLHRLASFLPDELRIIVSIEGEGDEREILLSKERFRHIEVKEEEQDATVGCVLPIDELCDAKTRKELKEMFLWLKQQKIAFRCIPEALLNEEWAGLETLIFLAPSITKLGQRMAQGFIAAGGRVQYFDPASKNENC
jgi:hypothetical protein